MKRCVVALAALALGCASVPWSMPRVAECPGALFDPGDIPGGNFALRERARVVAPGIELALELLVERVGDRLVLVGFDAFGARIFSVVQEGMTLEVDSRLGRALPITPEALLRDLQAARFGRAETAERVTVHRIGCTHSTTFVRAERRELP